MSKSKNMPLLAWIKTVSVQKLFIILFIFQNFFPNHHKEIYKQASAVYKFFC